MTDGYAQYMQMDLADHVGDWVAIDNDQIIAHGKDFKQVFDAARKHTKNKTPFIVRVPEHSTMIF